jgi:hypothetical protein
MKKVMIAALTLTISGGAAFAQKNAPAKAAKQETKQETKSEAKKEHHHDHHAAADKKKAEAKSQKTDAHTAKGIAK